MACSQPSTRTARPGTASSTPPTAAPTPAGTRTWGRTGSAPAGSPSSPPGRPVARRPAVSAPVAPCWCGSPGQGSRHALRPAVDHHGATDAPAAASKAASQPGSISTRSTSTHHPVHPG